MFIFLPKRIFQGIVVLLISIFVFDFTQSPRSTHSGGSFKCGEGNLSTLTCNNASTTRLVDFQTSLDLQKSLVSSALPWLVEEKEYLAEAVVEISANVNVSQGANSANSTAYQAMQESMQRRIAGWQHLCHHFQQSVAVAQSTNVVSNINLPSFIGLPNIVCLEGSQAWWDDGTSKFVKWGRDHRYEIHPLYEPAVASSFSTKNSSQRLFSLEALRMLRRAKLDLRLAVMIISYLSLYHALNDNIIPAAAALGAGIGPGQLRSVPRKPVIILPTTMPGSEWHLVSWLSDSLFYPFPVRRKHNTTLFQLVTGQIWGQQDADVELESSALYFEPHAPPHYRFPLPVIHRVPRCFCAGIIFKGDMIGAPKRRHNTVRQRPTTYIKQRLADRHNILPPYGAPDSQITLDILLQTGWGGLIGRPVKQRELLIRASVRSAPPSLSYEAMIERVHRIRREGTGDHHNRTSKDMLFEKEFDVAHQTLSVLPQLSASPPQGMVSTKDSYRMLFLLRRATRTIEDVAKLFAVCVRAGFIVFAMYPEEYSFLDQYRLARYADVLIGGHGQALSWMFVMDGIGVKNCRTAVELLHFGRRLVLPHNGYEMFAYDSYLRYVPIPAVDLKLPASMPYASMKSALLRKTFPHSLPGFAAQSMIYNIANFEKTIFNVAEQLKQCLVR